MSDVPIVLGEVTGWRAWRVVLDGLDLPRLTSIWNDDVWPWDDWMRARCRNARHEPPEKTCGCGVYVARSPETLLRLRYQDESYGSYGRAVETRVLGEVGLAGKIIPGENTYRAARARVVRLWVPHSAWELARPLAERYRVPVRLGNIRKFAEEVAAL